LSGRGLCDELITRPEESYRLCCVVVCDLETSRMGAPYIYDIGHLRVNDHVLMFSAQMNIYFSSYLIFHETANVKVKCTPVQALTLCTSRTAQRGSRCVALLIHHHGTRRGWGVSVTPRPLFSSRKESIPIVQEAGWAPGPVWTGAENLAPTGIRSPDRPARSHSLCRLRYPADSWNCTVVLPFKDEAQTALFKDPVRTAL